MNYVPNQKFKLLPKLCSGRWSLNTIIWA